MACDRLFATLKTNAKRAVGLVGVLALVGSSAHATDGYREVGYHPAVPIQGVTAAPADLVARMPFEGVERKYLVHVPPQYDGSRPLPLVLCLHGGGGDIGFAVRMFKFNQKADKEGFIVAYPNGSGRMHDHVLTWNATACCGYAKARKMNDIGFIREFLDGLETEFKIDKKRVYLVGFSNGAMMAYKLASEMPEKFAAFAVISGSMNGTEHMPALPISALIIHGKADKHIPVNGGGGKLAKWGFNVHAQPLDYAVDFWAHANDCQPAKVARLNGGEVECKKFEHGKSGSEVVVYTIDGYKHSWPGGNRAWLRADPPYPKLSATDECWSFFSRHTRDLSTEQLAQHLP
jgi:polyhydroxybutyrate depolymerase